MNAFIQTKRLLLSKFTTSDGELLFHLNSDPDVVKYVHEPSTTKENAPQILKEIILPQYELGLGRWAVYLKDTNEFIGWCGLKLTREKDEIDLGYRFSKQYWGKGYATEAAQACLDYGLGYLKLQRIVAKAHMDNIGSWKVMEKCGMRFLKEDVEDGQPVRVYEVTSSSTAK